MISRGLSPTHPTSVCRNAGTNYLDAAGHPKYDGGSVDLIGSPRLLGSAVDIGALEYVPNTGLMLLVR